MLLLQVIPRVELNWEKKKEKERKLVKKTNQNI